MLSNSSATHQQLGNALEALRLLVEPIDAANSEWWWWWWWVWWWGAHNDLWQTCAAASPSPLPCPRPAPSLPHPAPRCPADLHGMGGLAPVVALLSSAQPAALQARAAHLLGTAASNNHEFHAQLLQAHPEVLTLLLRLLAAGSASAGSAGAAGQQAAEAAEAGAKALYCLSAILRLSGAARGAFYRAAGVRALQQLLGSRGAGVRLKRKALGLLTDLVQLDAGDVGAVAGGGGGADAPATAGAQQQARPAAGLDYPAAVSAALQLLDAGREDADAAPDFDMQEKALLALMALLDTQGGSAAAAAFTQSGGDAVLVRLQSGLRAAAAADEDGGDFLLEVVQLAARVRARAAAAAAGGGHDATEL